MLIADRIERWTLSERQVVAVLLAAGAKDMTLPDPAERLANFDAALVAEAKQVNPDQKALLEVLGVG